MDPITAAIVAAATFLGPEAAKEGVKKVVGDAYDGLKAVIRRKWGGDSAVAQSVEAIEKKPESKGLRIDLAEEVEKAGAAKDAEVLAALKALTEALAKTASENPSTRTLNVNATNVGVGAIENFAGTLNVPMSSDKG